MNSLSKNSGENVNNEYENIDNQSLNQAQKSPDNKYNSFYVNNKNFSSTGASSSHNIPINQNYETNSNYINSYPNPSAKNPLQNPNLNINMNKQYSNSNFYSNQNTYQKANSYSTNYNNSSNQGWYSNSGSNIYINNPSNNSINTICNNGNNNFNNHMNTDFFIPNSQQNQIYGDKENIDEPSYKNEDTDFLMSNEKYNSLSYINSLIEDFHRETCDRNYYLRLKAKINNHENKQKMENDSHNFIANKSEEENFQTINENEIMQKFIHQKLNICLDQYKKEINNQNKLRSESNKILLNIDSHQISANLKRKIITDNDNLNDDIHISYFSNNPDLYKNGGDNESRDNYNTNPNASSKDIEIELLISDQSSQEIDENSNLKTLKETISKNFNQLIDYEEYEKFFFTETGFHHKLEDEPLKSINGNKIEKKPFSINLKSQYFINRQKADYPVLVLQPNFWLNYFALNTKNKKIEKFIKDNISNEKLEAEKNKILNLIKDAEKADFLVNENLKINKPLLEEDDTSSFIANINNFVNDDMCDIHYINIPQYYVSDENFKEFKDIEANNKKFQKEIYTYEINLARIFSERTDIKKKVNRLFCKLKNNKEYVSQLKNKLKKSKDDVNDYNNIYKTENNIIF